MDYVRSDFVQVADGLHPLGAGSTDYHWVGVMRQLGFVPLEDQRLEAVARLGRELGVNHASCTDADLFRKRVGIPHAELVTRVRSRGWSPALHLGNSIGLGNFTTKLLGSQHYLRDRAFSIFDENYRWAFLDKLDRAARAGSLTADEP